MKKGFFKFANFVFFISFLFFLYAFFLNLVSIDLKKYSSLKVSDHKSIVLEKLSGLGVRYIIPLVGNDFSISIDNISDVDQLSEIYDLCITNNRGVFIKIKFDVYGEILKVFGPNDKKNYGFEEGQSRDKVNFIIKKIIADDKKIVASYCIAEQKWVSLLKISHEDLLYLFKYDKWSFQVPNSYSTVDLVFKNNHLDMIVYHYRFYES